MYVWNLGVKGLRATRCEHYYTEHKYSFVGTVSSFHPFPTRSGIPRRTGEPLPGRKGGTPLELDAVRPLRAPQEGAEHGGVPVPRLRLLPHSARRAAGPGAPRLVRLALLSVHGGPGFFERFWRQRWDVPQVNSQAHPKTEHGSFKHTLWRGTTLSVFTKSRTASHSCNGAESFRQGSQVFQLPCYTMQSHLVKFPRTSFGEKVSSCNSAFSLGISMPVGALANICPFIIIPLGVHPPRDLVAQEKGRAREKNESNEPVAKRAYTDHQPAQRGRPPLRRSIEAKQTKTTLDIAAFMESRRPYRSRSLPGRATFRGNRPDSAEESSWRCDQCLKAFANPEQMEVHRCSGAPEGKSRSCPHCNRAFSNDAEFRLHVESHINERPFRCGYCASAFASAAMLNQHVRVHMNEEHHAKLPQLQDRDNRDVPHWANPVPKRAGPCIRTAKDSGFVMGHVVTIWGQNQMSKNVHTYSPWSHQLSRWLPTTSFPGSSISFYWICPSLSSFNFFNLDNEPKGQ